MEIYRDLTPAGRECAVALGMFDGLHLGHRKVISLALEGAARGLAPAVLTFADNPKLRGIDGGALLSQKEKIRLLREMGVEFLYLLDSASVKNISAEDFVRSVLKNACMAEEACCGFNYTFGRGGKAGSGELRRLCAACGIGVSVAPAVLADGEPVSSTRIRALIRAGDVEKAALLLGRPFSYELPVVSGQHLGRRLGTPTLNQRIPPESVLPKFGVYASLAEAEGRSFCGVTNVGVHPTVGVSRAALAETWMPEYAGPPLYGRETRVSLLKFLRPERKFPSLAALQEEIRRNGAQSLAYFREKFPDSGAR